MNFSKNSSSSCSGNESRRVDSAAPGPLAHCDCASVAQGARNSAALWTPVGYHTEVSDEDLALLEKNATFQLHKKNGFVRVDKKNTDIEKAVADMNRVDGESSPKTEADFPDYIVSTEVPTSRDPHRI